MRSSRRKLVRPVHWLLNLGVNDEMAEAEKDAAYRPNGVLGVVILPALLGFAILWLVGPAGVGRHTFACSLLTSIAPQKLAELFQPFTQGDPTMQRIHDGTGLGLPIARQPAEMMGGRIEVESTLGEGSTFSFVLELGRLKDMQMPELDGYSATRMLRLCQTGRYD